VEPPASLDRNRLTAVAPTFQRHLVGELVVPAK
jgi:hypothetical protein